ncbi:Alpha/Beta hydrolase protein [Aspergillus karnatakaensis]|uniref:epoxide hydrolase family protein n=1 Tax=Aspergillus karnatakaensis TaxID=1810916 RepID=UPI003CCD29E3
MKMASQFNTLPQSLTAKVEPYTLHVSNKDLLDFKELLRLSPIGPSTWWNQHKNGRYGISRDWLINAKETWLSSFNWRSHEEHINNFPNFKIAIKDHEAGDVSVHFTALFSKRKDAIPVVFLHGYPGSFVEFLPMLQLLVEKYTPDTLPYHVIVPSLPDYGLSSGASENVEMTLERSARILNQLMVDLGFGGGYIAQGGDLGSMLARLMSVRFEECKAFHINMLALNPDQIPPSPRDDIAPKDAEHLKRSEVWQQTGFAYALEHATRPATIGLAISSSPIALLSWIGEKLLEWVDPRHPLPLDTILGMVTLWWFTSTLPRSLYHAELVKKLMSGKPHEISTEKPMGYSLFEYDLALVPEAWVRELYPNLVAFNRHDPGAHFASLEQPQLLLDDVEGFIEAVKGRGIF